MKKLIMKGSGDYRKPYSNEDDLFLSGKEIGKRYPEYTAFLQPGVVAVIVDKTTNRIIRKIYNNPKTATLS